MIDRKMKNKFVWQPGVSAPFYYTAVVKYAYVGYGTKGKRFPTMVETTRRGIGRGSMAVALDDFDEPMDLPNSLDILWISIAEKQIYKGNFVFSQELQDKILGYFSQGFWDEGEKRTYECFSLTLLPGGRICPYLSGSGRTVCLDTILQCTPIQMDFLDLNLNTSYKTLDDYVNAEYEYSDQRDMKEHQMKYGVPYKIWDRYLERFNYDICFEYEAKDSVVEYGSIIGYANGEIFDSMSGVNPEFKSRIKDCKFRWKVNKTIYSGYFYFNEDEVLNYFERAYGEKREQKGMFIIRVSKYDNWFDIILKVGGKEFNLEKTQIRVFRRLLEERNGYNFYENYNEEETKRFVGE